MKKKKGKKTALFLMLLLVVAVVAGYHFGILGLNNAVIVYVEKVSDIISLGSGNGGQNRYAGIVESQEVWNISENENKTIKEVYVKEGDTVEVGDKLFAYDNEEAKLSLAQAELELERMENEIKAGEAEIANLEREKKSVSSSNQIEYTIQIQSQKALNKKTEYEMKSQKAKIESLKKATKNSVVKSQMAGVVQKINQAAISDGLEVEEYTDGEDGVFMSILATGDYRIKAMVNEQNRWTLEEGKAVIIRSRVDENLQWSGTIGSIDTKNPDSSETDMSASSQYPFYVDLDSSDGLMLGQHVYIELNEGQDEEKEGIWLDSYYIMQEEIAAATTAEGTGGEVQSYVWVENSMKRLEKRVVTLGGYDLELDKHEIVSGLTEEDYIAFPEEGFKSGLRTTRNIEEAVSEEEIGSEGSDEEFLEDMDNQGDESQEYEEEGGIFQEFEGEEGLEDDTFDDGGAVGSLEWLAEVLL